MWANESAFRPDAETRARLDAIWTAMQACVKRGCSGEGTLPGGLQVKRRAKAIHHTLLNSPKTALKDPLTILDWVNLYALAVNEENAAGGRVVTAPTNGAAGIIPAVLQYAVRFRNSPFPDGVAPFSADRRGDRHALQAQRLDLRRGSRLPGRGRRGLLDGRRRASSSFSAAPRTRWKTPPRSAWNTTSA